MKRCCILPLFLIATLVAAAQASVPLRLHRPLTYVTADSVAFFEYNDNWRRVALQADADARPQTIAPFGRRAFKRQAAAWERRVRDSLNLVGGTGEETATPQLGPALQTLRTSASLFLSTADSRYMEAAERALMNAVTAGAVRGRTAAERTAAARALITAPSLVYATDDEGVYVNLFVNCYAVLHTKGYDGAIDQVTDMPTTGGVVLRFRPRVNSRPMTLRMRLPLWASGVVYPSGRYAAEGGQPLPTVYINGKEALSSSVEGGYLVVRRNWNFGDELRVEFPLPVLTVRRATDGAVRRGQVALQRGPLTYVATTPTAGCHFSPADRPLPDYEEGYASFAPLKGHLYRSSGTPADAPAPAVPFEALPYAYAAPQQTDSLTLWLPESR